jgi:hypothetical protein
MPDALWALLPFVVALACVGALFVVLALKKPGPRILPVGKDEAGWPVCPHCGGAVGTVVNFRSTMPTCWNNLHVFACPACRKVLGVQIKAK